MFQWAVMYSQIPVWNTALALVGSNLKIPYIPPEQIIRAAYNPRTFIAEAYIYVNAPALSYAIFAFFLYLGYELFLTYMKAGYNHVKVLFNPPA